MSEIIADSGDVFVVRECDDGDGCTVIERYLTKCAMQNEPPDDEPHDSIHIPRDVLTALAKQLQDHAWVLADE